MGFIVYAGAAKQRGKAALCTLLFAILTASFTENAAA